MDMTVRAVAMLICLLLVVTPIACAQSSAGRGDNDERPVGERLENLAERLRLGLTVASVAAYSPTLADIRHHAQQLINMLEGAQGQHYVRPFQPLDEWPGIMPELVVISTRLDGQAFEPETRTQIAAAVNNTRTFLSLALEAALSGRDQRRLDLATLDMLRVYSYLAAAYEAPCDTAYVPTLRTLVRILGATGTDPSV
ncbi:hypothetical protein KJ567_00695 [Candidatus Bipolaricaulota bacterium]|nr:hypothetical protein [Candidatus Bipolaricaulota bacterium]